MGNYTGEEQVGRRHIIFLSVHYAQIKVRRVLYLLSFNIEVASFVRIECVAFLCVYRFGQPTARNHTDIFVPE